MIMVSMEMCLSIHREVFIVLPRQVLLQKNMMKAEDKLLLKFLWYLI